MDGVAESTLPLPRALSPSRISSFKDCGLAFRYSTIDKLPESTSEPAVLGSVVHRALELLFCHAPANRTPEAAAHELEAAIAEYETGDEMSQLELDGAGMASFTSRAELAVERYFELEDPRTVEPIGLELKLEGEIAGVSVRGIIDRLDRRADGSLVVVDYKTGRPPGLISEQQRMLGVHIYASLVEQLVGRRPAEVALYYINQPVVIATEPSDQAMRGLEVKIGAMWNAIERACERGEFRPRPSGLCDWCSFQRFCPEFGGSVALAWEISAANPASVALDLPV